MPHMTTTTNTKYTFTADTISALRDGDQQSWRNVAQALGLGSPGAARRAYTTLVRPHTESVLAGRTIATAKLTPVDLSVMDLAALRVESFAPVAARADDGARAPGFATGKPMCTDNSCTLNFLDCRPGGGTLPPV